MYNNNKRKLNKQETNKYVKDMRKKKEKKTGRTVGGDNISNWAGLPEDIINDILPMLPAKAIVRFRCVCKSWYHLFKTTSFTKLQLKYNLNNRNDGILIDNIQEICYLDYDLLSSDSSTLYDKLVHISYPLEYGKKEILGSCNGLVCYRSYQKDTIIWNPFTKDYKKISRPPKPGCTLNTYGFGYDSITDDYKLVMYFVSVYPLMTRIHVYSLKFDSWKTIVNTNIPLELPADKDLVFFKGFFHWVSKYSEGPKKLSCFDTVNLTVKHILLPQHSFEKAQVCLLGGCLCVIGIDLEKDIREVWMMKDYGVAESWTKMFTIGNMKLLRFQHFDFKHSIKNDSVLVHHCGTSTYLYDVNHELVKELKIRCYCPWYRRWSFSGSLVSPNLGT